MKKLRLFKYNNQYCEYAKKIDCYILYVNDQKKSSWSYLLFSFGGSVVIGKEFKNKLSAIKNGELAAKQAKRELVEYTDTINTFLKKQKSYN